MASWLLAFLPPLAPPYKGGGSARKSVLSLQPTLNLEETRFLKAPKYLHRRRRLLHQFVFADPHEADRPFTLGSS
jgi:hypothetical protein